MSAYNLLDLSRVPVPDIIEALDFESIYQQLKDQLLAINPDYREVLALESEPMAVLLQSFAYRELLLRAQINDATRANMLASATGADLDNIGARYNVGRLVVQEADDSTIPVTPQILEDDTSYRRRIQMAFNGLNTAGSENSYIFHALSADSRVTDADVVSPQPSDIVLTILSKENGDGSASDELLAKVRNYFGLSDDGSALLAQTGSDEPEHGVRPLGDRLTIKSAGVQSYQIRAEISLLAGPGKENTLALVHSALQAYTRENQTLGKKVTLLGIYTALNQAGVDSVNLLQPTQDIQVASDQVAYCSDIILTEVNNV
ncbi:baseplate J/gp47 family protein [Thalassomonas viridans]|uniref:Baseplate J/gp47 family protein n=1 Tax=Thalassomonas viridans TaxID=137584 RepID=A0AAE9Z272_9GAMM|nr:baseplate J/gp47 family protein [Thalassomonas viridans]WDE04685.1 baseplate J/gp47 family protein [Thalassomonas viridans]